MIKQAMVLFYEQEKEGLMAVIGAGRKTRKGHIDWLMKQTFVT